MEREVGGGIGMGNTCKSTADSFQCMTKPTTIKKIKKCKKFKKLILIVGHYYVTMNFPDGSVVKNRPATERDADSFSVSGRSPGEGNGNPLLSFHLGNPMDQ